MTRISEAHFQDRFQQFKMVDRDYRWYVLYTRSQHEKRLHSDLTRLGIESFLPLVSSIRLWSDRKKIVDLPLFPNYLFVCSSCREYISIVEHPSVIGFVKNGSLPSVISDSTIAMLRIASSEKMEMVQGSFEHEEGVNIVINQGPLAGFAGEIVKRRGNNYLLIELSQIRQRVLVKIKTESVMKSDEKLKPCTLFL